MAWCKSECATKLHDLRTAKSKLLNDRFFLQKRQSEYKLRSKKQQFDADTIEMAEIVQDLIDVDRQIAKLENALKHNSFRKKPT